MLAGLSRWVREVAPARLVPTRFRAPLERWTAARAYPAPAAPLRWSITEDSAQGSLLLGGDLALHRWQPGDAPEAVVSGLRTLAQSADALVLNLETQLTARPRPAGTIGTSLKADPSAIAVLSYLGVRAVTCANNHCLDYEHDGLRESVDRLEEAGITVTGVIGEGRSPGAVVRVAGIRVGLLGFSDDWWVAEDAGIGIRPAPHDPALVREQVTAMRSAADLVVVQLHWGYEWSMYPMLTLRNLARSYIEAGANIVVCHHAHVPMGVETWRRGAIAHGLGNLYFGRSERQHHPFRNSSYVLRAEISRSGIAALELLPVITDAQGRAGPASGQSARIVTSAIGVLSSRLENDDYLAAVEASITARHGCEVLLDLHRRVEAGDRAGVGERVRFFGPPRQRALLASLRSAGGFLERMGNLFDELHAGRMDPFGPAAKLELEGLSREAVRYLDRFPQKGRIP
jgi:poly-gamma-glutamate capsule biosynthesis protein CapA/YwtB (metallophosphatase superfamily)